MSSDLPDETSRLYRYVKQLDRRVTKLRHTDPVMKECVSSREKNHKMPYLLVIEN